MLSGVEEQRQRGNEAFRQGHLEEALSLYTSAIQMLSPSLATTTPAAQQLATAPGATGEPSPSPSHGARTAADVHVDRECLATLLSNRALVFRRMGRPMLAMDDAVRSISLCPSRDKPFYVKALALLDLPPYSDYYLECGRLQSVVQCLDECLRLQSASKVKCNTKEVEGKLHEAQSQYVRTYYVPHLKNLPPNVTVKHIGGDLGKGVFSLVDYEPWSLLYAEQPLVSRCLPGCPSEKRTCMWCMRSFLTAEAIPSILPSSVHNILYPQGEKSGWLVCKFCERELYCSEACQSSAWKQHHKVLCPQHNQHHPALLLENMCRQKHIVNPLLIARMMCSVAEHVISDRVSLEVASQCFEIFVTNPWPTEGENEMVALIQQAFSLQEEYRQFCATLVTLENFQKFNGVLQRNASSVHPVSDLHLFINDAIEHTTRPFITLNGTQLNIADLRNSLDGMQESTPTGTGLYAITNTINHSCNPNVVHGTPNQSNRPSHITFVTENNFFIMTSSTPTTAPPSTHVESCCGGFSGSSRSVPFFFRVGVDVGGTNTDAAVVRVDEEEGVALGGAKRHRKSVVGCHKELTTEDVVGGVVSSIRGALSEFSVNPALVASVTIGTTSFLNALLQRKRLAKVAVIRLAAPGSEIVPPFIDFPSDLRLCVEGMWRVIKGGYEVDGRESYPLDEASLRAACRIARNRNLKIFALSCSFSTVNSAMEQRAAEIISHEVPHALITMSSGLHQINLLQRENATILNSCLLPLAYHTINAFSAAIKELGLPAQLLISQNDGTVATTENAVKWPVLCVGSGPTNSMRGAALVTGIKTTSIVMDIGGTTTDVGIIEKGFPRLAGSQITIAGVTTNFRMPDTLSIPLGGGTIVFGDETHMTLGPVSVGHHITTKALIFGGDVITTTDVAVAAGLANVGDGTKVTKLTPEFISSCMKNIMEKLTDVVDSVKTAKEPLPLILVGGGGILVPSNIPGTTTTLRPENGSSANAVGAAFPQISGSIDVYVKITPETRTSIVDGYIEEAKSIAVRLGAERSSLEILELSETTPRYVTGGLSRLQIKVAGDISDTLTLASEYTIPRAPPGLTFGTDENEWLLTDEDIDNISLGAGILGTGGGGSTYSTRLKMKNLMQNGAKPRVVQVDSIPSNSHIGVVAFLGDPSVMTERYMRNPNANALQAVEQFTGIEATHLSSLEAGGTNCLEPLCLSLMLGLPVLNADGMGRAFPKIEMTLPYIFHELALSPSPAAMGLDSGEIRLFKERMTAAEVEEHVRNAVVEMGCASGLCLGILSKEEARESLVHGSITKAWELGKAVLEARRNKENPITAVTSKGGKLLFTGKIVDIEKKPTSGFSKGKITIQGLQEYERKSAFIKYQNENLIVKECSEEPGESKKVLATVPDLICILESSTGTPIFTEELKYGLRVSVIVLPCHPLYRTEKALRLVGPQAFGYKHPPKLL
ncbi:Hydantoin utilization protein A [Pelomyxa schiedti]|nr:Hydantoin utilization protein A [Pelomyxa schiedti]